MNNISSDSDVTNSDYDRSFSSSVSGTGTGSASFVNNMNSCISTVYESTIAESTRTEELNPERTVGTGALNQSQQSRVSALSNLSNFDGEVFLHLIEKSYSFMLHEGLQNMGDICKAKTTDMFGTTMKWNVIQCKNVKYDELVADMMNLRHNIEVDLQQNIIQHVLLRKYDLFLVIVMY